MFERIKNLFRGEPVVVVAGLVALVTLAVQEVVASVDASAGWRTVALAVAAAIARQLVTPVKPEPETAEQQAFWSGEPRL